MDPEVRRHIQYVWYDMKKRCYDAKNNRYNTYGARGIQVCERWMIFDNFLKDMCSTYRKGLTIDRINNNGNYEPENCRWATDKQQKENRSDNHYITFKGITDTLTNWANYLRIKKTTLHNRLNYYGWTIEEALTMQRGKRGDI